VGKIKCYILKKNREVEVLTVSDKYDYFRYRDGIYMLRKENVAFPMGSGIVSDTPELFFVENFPQPISFKTDEETLVPKWLDETVIKNIIKQTAKPKGVYMQILVDYARNPWKLFPLLLFLLVAGAMIKGMIFGG